MRLQAVRGDQEPFQRYNFANETTGAQRDPVVRFAAHQK
jgi:hypothetical protein